FYEDGGIMFCKFCSHSVDYKQSNTVKDHIESKKHRSAMMDSLQGGTLPQQSTIRQLYLPKLFDDHVQCLKEKKADV
ncbi:uncharacterized protein LOC130010737, partial [Patella vulgata]|uniref:uncharacterized protein LOC130010737 n=1 Tax=Patella vulgata TaxID=6465 RepID=UPI0024A87282